MRLQDLMNHQMVKVVSRVTVGFRIQKCAILDLQPPLKATCHLRSIQ
jgi:hypothetical protein